MISGATVLEPFSVFVIIQIQTRIVIHTDKNGNWPENVIHKKQFCDEI